MMNNKAIATLLIGDAYIKVFNEYFRKDWTAYCSRYDIDLVIIEAPLDTSERASKRSPAWQKCIIHQHPSLKRYDQIAWVDADIKIRRNAPNIFNGIPIEKIGATDEYATPTPEDHYAILKNNYDKWDQLGVKYIRNLTPQEYHENFGLKGTWSNVVQTGVFVYSPKIHSEILERVYNNYEDKGHASWNYEMRPLSHEMISSGNVQWLSPKFNMVWNYYKEYYYPFLETEYTSRFRKKRAKKLYSDCVKTAFENNYFLHFAGGSTSYKLL